MLYQVGALILHFVLGEPAPAREVLLISLVPTVIVNVALTLAKRAVFMEKGEVRFSGPTAELLERPDILRAVFLQGAAAG